MLLAVAGMVLFVGLFGRAETQTSIPGAKPSRTEVNHAIELAAGYLERNCDSTGKFAYEVDVMTGKQSNSYDIIRHAGAMYALGMYNHAHPDPRAVEALVRAADFMRKNYIAPGFRPDQLVVWSKPLPEGDQPRDQYAELGGTALGIVGLAELRNVKREGISLSELKALGHFLLFLQKSDGSFVQKYDLRSGPVTNWHSLYYPGEAALAFVYLYEMDHSTVWLRAAGKALSYLAKGRVDLSSVPADHWALIATAKLLPHCGKDECGVERVQLIQYAVQVCTSILAEQWHGTALDGAFDPTGRTAPAATRLEGLLSALEFLPQDELRERIGAATNRGIAFLLRTQLSSGPYEGGLPGAFADNTKGRSVIRIDYLQHALCSWLRYESLSRGSVDSHGSRPQNN